MSEAVRHGDTAGEAANGVQPRTAGGERAALALGTVAALLVGACCAGPLILVSIGLGGAWLANLTALEPYRPIFAAVALVSLAFAWRRIYRPAAECNLGEACAVPAARRGYKIGFWTVAALLVGMFAFPYLAPLIF